MTILPVVPPITDGSALLTLNNADAEKLSQLDAAGLTALVSKAFVAVQVEGPTAMLIAFDQDCDYDSPNFLWFRARYERFAYVDRVVVAGDKRGQGLARALYTHLFTVAAAAGHGLVTCEVNADPPNPGSDKFHRALGFTAVGFGRPAGQDKTVTYYARELG